MSQITKTKITQILNSCKFNPRISGPLKIIADVGNVDYYCNRAIEFIEQSKLEAIEFIEQSKLEGCGEKQCLEKAISLLALAIANNEET